MKIMIMKKCPKLMIIYGNGIISSLSPVTGEEAPGPHGAGEADRRGPESAGGARAALGETETEPDEPDGVGTDTPSGRAQSATESQGCRTPENGGIFI